MAKEIDGAFKDSLNVSIGRWACTSDLHAKKSA